MSRKRTSKSFTANQLVAANLRRAREQSGLTQEQAAVQLWPYLGVRWSPAVFSAAETSVKTTRVREFDANEILAFACVFGKPIAWFFMPPDEELDQVVCGNPLDVTNVVGRAQLMNAALPHGLALREQVATLRRVADELERGDKTALPAGGADKPAGKVGIGQFVPEEEGDQDA